MALVLMIGHVVLPVAGWPGPAGAATAGVARDLHLDVRLAGASIGLIGAFRQRADGTVVSQRKELEELGVRVPDSYRPDDEVPLAAIPGLSYAYDEARQSIDITVPQGALLPKSYDARPAADKPVASTPSATGAALNYTLFGASDARQVDQLWQYPSLAATLDLRVFGSWGVVSQTGIVTSASLANREAEALRLDTVWSYSDPATLLSYRGGDVISGGLAWTRPIRLGGVQVQRNFGLRPDLITLPLPSVSGSAAVPSTVDVFVNGVRTISQDVASGPFRINNLPILSGNGNASIVVRDASGQQTQTTQPFIVSSQLLRPGLFDVSAEAGLPRLQYGLRSSLYAQDVAGSGSLRYGLTDTITLQAHGEATRSLAGGGLGAVIGLGQIGLLGLASSGSWHDGATGGQAYASFETRIGAVAFIASTQRSFGQFQDLASVASSPLSQALGGYGAIAGLSGDLAGSDGWMKLLRPPRALDRASIGFPVFGNGLNIGVAHVQSASGTRNRVVNASVTRSLPRGGVIYATVFADLDHRKTAGIFAGLSFPLGGDVIASAGVSRSGAERSMTTELARPIGQEPGSIGWRVRDSEGSQPRRSVALAYRGDNGMVEVGAAQTGGRVSGTAQLDGAIVVAAGGVFLANRIDDAFAVAKVGAPDVDVLFENRVVARTNSDGNALIPTLRAYQSNKIAIDTRGLPVTALATATQDVIAPPDRAGVVVEFGVRSVATSAIVTLVDRDGTPLAPGSSGVVQLALRGAQGQGPPFVVGYDGRAFIENLGADNIVQVQRGGALCSARFPFAPKPDAQVMIGPVTCQ